MGAKKILIIDDEGDFCELIKANLELRGSFEVFIAINGKEGIDIARRVKPDIVLLDIRMPEMNGFEVLKRLKRDNATVAIPVIMLSALVDEESKLMAAQLFNELYITKPVKFEDLENSIGEVLKRRDLSKPL
ncbi:MAG: response regulator [Candidatus Omnitrophota bacterium]|nr:response regulator [Candidatus Omnitrophota bacterium]